MKIRTKLFVAVLLISVSLAASSFAYQPYHAQAIPASDCEVLCDMDPIACDDCMGGGGGGGGSWHSLCRVFGGEICSFDIPEGYSTVAGCEDFNGDSITICRGPYAGASCIIEQDSCIPEEFRPIALELGCVCSSITECDPTDLEACSITGVEGFNLCNNDEQCNFDFWCGDDICQPWENFHSCNLDCPTPGDEQYDCGDGAICIQTEYSGGGFNRVISLIDEHGRFVSSTYNTFEELIEINKYGLSINYQYDLMGNPLTIMDTNSRTNTENKYNTLGQLVWSYNIDSGEREYEYYDNGNLWKVIQYSNPNNNPNDNGGGNQLHIIETEYDSLDRVRYVRVDGNIVLENIYDGCDNPPDNYASGRLCSMVDSLYGTEIHYKYDREGNIINIREVIDGSDYITEYGYDLVGSVISILTLHDGVRVEYRYNLLGQLIFVDIPGNSIEYKYNDDGTIDYVDYPNAIRTNYEYDLRSWIDRITVGVNGLDPVFDERYDYDEVGNLIRIEDLEAGIDNPHGLDGNCVEFFYDNQSRLDYTLDRGQDCTGGSSNWGHYYLNPSASGVNLDYEYDNVGNRLNRVVGGYEGYVDDTDYIYGYEGDNNKLDQTTDADGTVCDYGYDDIGNMISKDCEDSITVYRYDINNMIDRIDLPDNSVLEFEYDPLGRRVKKVVSIVGEISMETIYIYGIGINPLLEDTHEMMAS
jgi:YD repeat-containing protein